MSTFLKSMLLLVVSALALSFAWPSAQTADDAAALKFVKHVIDADFPAISATAVDVDGDGLLDVIAAGGPSGGVSKWSNLVYWYKAPNWEKQLVCRLDPKAVILHIEAVDFTNPVTRKKAQASVEITVTDGQLGEIWWVRFDRATGKWTSSIILDDVQYAHGTAVGDIDGDGFLDLLAPVQANAQKRGVVWAKNPGKPGEQAKRWPKHALADKFAIDGWLHYVRLADINGDGKLDALLGSDGDKGWLGYWLQGDKPTGSWDVHVLPGPMRQTTHLEAVDLNKDGKVDLVATEGHGRGLWWFPAPQFKPIRIDDTLASAHSLAIGDFDGDGSLDLASCGYESKEVACFLNDGKGNFRKVTLDKNQCAYDAKAVDLDGDGDLDILLSGQNSGNLVWYENQRIKRKK